MRKVTFRQTAVVDFADAAVLLDSASENTFCGEVKDVLVLPIVAVLGVWKRRALMLSGAAYSENKILSDLFVMQH